MVLGLVRVCFPLWEAVCCFFIGILCLTPRASFTTTLVSVSLVCLFTIYNSVQPLDRAFTDVPMAFMTIICPAWAIFNCMSAIISTFTLVKKGLLFAIISFVCASICVVTNGIIYIMSTTITDSRIYTPMGASLIFMYVIPMGFMIYYLNTKFDNSIAEAAAEKKRLLADQDNEGFVKPRPQMDHRYM